VRAALLGLQRGLGKNGGVVLEGRDIGTVVFPDAEAKVFLTASPPARAGRRVSDLQGRGIEADFDTTLAEVQARDAQDEGRAVAPLRPAEGAAIVDSTELSFDQVVARVVEIARAAMKRG
jgi:cytidylate kinase